MSLSERRSVVVGADLGIAGAAGGTGRAPASPACTRDRREGPIQRQLGPPIKRRRSLTLSLRSPSSEPKHFKV